MRLTDRPKTLAEMMPEKSWPETLQATLDKALARDAEDRYASAAQFGRDFAAAIADMPMTQAVEAGTMIVNAAAAGAAAKDIAKTRVAPEGRPSANTMPMQAPAAAKKAAGKAAPVEVVKKSAMPMVLGGVGGLAVVGFAAMKFLGGPTPTVAPPGPGTQTRPDSQVAQVPDPTPAVSDTGAGTKVVTPPRPDPNLLSKSGAPTPTKTPAPAPGTPGTTPAVTDYRASIAAWIRELDPTRANEAVGARVQREIDAVWDRLPSELMADAWFVKMEAFAIQGDNRTCGAAREVQQRSSDPGKRAKAGDYLRNSCDP